MPRPARPAASSSRKNDPGVDPKPGIPPGGLSPIEITAVALVGKEAPKSRDVLKPGTHPVDFLVWIAGEVEVGAATSRIATTLPTLAEVLEFTFASLGPKTRDTLRTEIVHAFRDGKRPAAGDKEVKQLALTAVELITDREQKEKRGDVIWKALRVTRIPPATSANYNAARIAAARR